MYIILHLQYQQKNMEKSTETITQQLLYLKKTLKKKRKSEIWQQTIQYYRNNQTSISNYHILKIIKIIMKPLKSSVLKNCNFLSKLSKLYFQGGGDDPKFNGQIRDQINNINTKIRAMENLLECYTLALENFMTASNPTYFNMIFRKSYHAKHPTKQLLFQPVAVTHQKCYPKQIIQHQLSSYLKFVSELSIAYYQSTIIKCFKQTDEALYEIFDSSHIFTTKKIMYELLKLNFLMKFENTGQCAVNTNHNKNQSNINKIPSSVGICLVNKIVQYQQIQVQYNFPLQLIHSLYKNYKKWQRPRIKNCFVLIFRYMYMISLNMGNKNLLIGYKVNQFLDQTKRNYSIQAQIYILMKQILNLNKYIHINLFNEFAKISLEFISSIIDGYELRLSQKQKLNDFIFRYFDFEQIRSMGQYVSRKQSIKQNNNIVITKKQQQNRNKNRVITLNSRNSKKSIYLNRVSQKIQAGSLQSMGNKVSKLFKQFGSVFNYIEQSDSDEDNVLVREFQQKRRDQIQNVQRKIRGNKKKDTPVSKMSNENSYMQIEEVNKKLDNLGEKTARLRSFSETALKKLQKKRTQNIQQDRLQKTNSIFNSNQNYQLQYNQLQKLHRTQTTVVDKQTYLKGSTKLPILQKHNEQPSKLHKQYQPILLSDKYDKMSQMILLANTSKQKNLNNI